MATRKRKPTPVKKINRTEYVNVRITPAFKTEVTNLANKLEIARTTAMMLCMRAGLTHINRSLFPEENFTPEQWASIVSSLDMSKLFQAENIDLDKLKEFGFEEI